MLSEGSSLVQIISDKALTGSNNRLFLFCLNNNNSNDLIEAGCQKTYMPTLLTDFLT